MPPLIMTNPVYPSDFGRRDTSASSVWQTRTYIDTKLHYFESTALTEKMAAFIYLPVGLPHRTLSVKWYPERKEFWTSYKVTIPTHVEAMAVDDHWAWMLTSERVFRTPLASAGATESVDIPVVANGRFLSVCRSGAVCGFAWSSELVFLSSSLSVTVVKTPYRGLTSITPIEDKFMCSVFGSGTVRMMTADGKEARTYIGHCAPVMGLVKLNESSIASRADDCSVRVWDVRERFPVLSICSSGPSIVNLAGSANFVIAALRDKTVSVFDIRKPCGKAVLGVVTQDYEPANLFYSQKDDTLAMFGVVDKEMSRESIMFMDNEAQSRQRIFRVYGSFLGTL
jgi:WD40 repeat protein